MAWWNHEVWWNRESAVNWLHWEILKDPNAVAGWIDSNRVNNLKYKIWSWDTLWQIAKSFWTTTEQLARDNNIADINKIYAWKTIEINKTWNSASVETRVHTPATKANSPSRLGNTSHTEARSVHLPKQEPTESPDPQKPIRAWGGELWNQEPKYDFDALKQPKDWWWARIETSWETSSFEEKYKDWKKQLDSIEVAVNEKIQKWVKFSKEQQKEAHKEFARFLEELNQEKWKLTNPQDIAKMDDLLAQLERVRKLYDSNVTTATAQEGWQDRVKNKDVDQATKLADTLRAIKEETPLSSWKIEWISYDWRILTLWDNKYYVGITYGIIPFSVDYIGINWTNVTAKTNIPLIWEKEGNIPKENIIDIIWQLLENGSYKTIVTLKDGGKITLSINKSNWNA